MTQERKTLISPHDIVAVGYLCPHCGSSGSVPIEKIDRVAVTCGNCAQRLISETQPSSSQLAESIVMKHFLEALRALQVRDFGNHVRLEIKGDPTLSASQK